MRNLSTFWVKTLTQTRYLFIPFLINLLIRRHFSLTTLCTSHFWKYSLLGVVTHIPLKLRRFAKGPLITYVIDSFLVKYPSYTPTLYKCFSNPRGTNLTSIQYNTFDFVKRHASFDTLLNEIVCCIKKIKVYIIN